MQKQIKKEHCHAASQVSPSLPHVTEPQKDHGSTEQDLHQDAPLSLTPFKPKHLWKQNFFAQGPKKRLLNRYKCDIDPLTEEMAEKFTPHDRAQGVQPGSISDDYFSLLGSLEGTLWHHVLKELGFPLAMEYIAFDHSTKQYVPFVGHNKTKPCSTPALAN